MRSALLLLALAAAPAVAQPAASPDISLLERYQATITPSELAGYLYVYADDYMAGRETGQPGQRFAAQFLAGQYQAMGIAPHGSGTSPGPYSLGRYLQPFDLEQKQLRSLHVMATRDGRTLVDATIRPGDTASAVLVPAYGVVTDASPARVVYVGYADEAAIADLDLSGAYAVALPGTPDAPTNQRATYGRAAALGARGVRGVLVPSLTADEMTASAGRAFGGGRLALPAQAGAETPAPRFPPIFLTTAATADRMLAGSRRTVAGTNRTPAASTTMLAVDAQQETVMVPTENVVAVVEGSDPVLKDEFVIVSGHLDHIGVDTSLVGDQINNGADDDGTGTVSLLEIAEAFQKAKDDGHGPRRSVLFLHVTGEEKGLLGSEYFADRDPLVPLASVAADLNIDMIGRHDPTYDGAASPYVYILGSELISTDIDAVNTRVNEETNLHIDLSKRFNSADDPNQFFRRSDHWNFGKHGIPFIFYFTGTHEDYHRPGDEAWKIDYDRMAMIARLVFGTAWEIANADARPAVSGTGFN